MKAEYIFAAVIYGTLAVAGGAYWIYESTTSPRAIFTREVKDVARDPRSVRVRRVREVNGGICGEVNSRNGAGGYTGYQELYVRRVIDRVYTVEPRSEARTACR